MASRRAWSERTKACYFLGLLAPLCLAACTTGGVKKSSQGPAPIDAQQQLTDAAKLVDAQDWPRAQAALRALIEAPTFGNLTSHQQYQVLWTAAAVGISRGDPELGYGYLVRVVSMPEAGFEQWTRLTYIAERPGHNAVAVHALTVVAQRWPEQLSTINAGVAYAIIKQARSLPHGASLELLGTLYAAHWKLEDGAEPSAAWRDLILLHMEGGRIADAIEVSSHITDPYVLIDVRSDRRFDALVATRPALFDIDVAATRGLHDLQMESEQSPRSLRLKTRVMGALQRQQHYSAMLAATDAVVMEMKATNFPEKLYDDYQSQYNWFLNERAIALRRVGLWEEAVAQLEAASRVSERQAQNVSQVLNLAILYCELNRPKEALSTIEPVGSVSAYGAMVKEQAHLEAAIQLGDQSQVKRSLDYMKLHSDVSPMIFFDGLIYANQLDDAAHFLIVQLMDPTLRLDMIGRVQEFATHPEPEWSAQHIARRREVIVRQDVQTAIQKVGRIESYHLEER
jgi:hypothetical protein